MEPAISILIANYNNGHYFREAFDSLLQQTCEDWEAVVIDDCSTDNSREIIKCLIGNDPRFRYYENPANIGYQKTILRAIALSKAAVFGRLDPDDTLTPKAVESSLAAHRKNPQAGLVYSDLNQCDSDLRIISVHRSQAVPDLDEKYLNLQGEIAPFCTFKKSIYERTSGIDAYLRCAEDKDIYMKMCETAPAVYVPQVLYNYRHHDGGMSTTGNEFRAFFWHWTALVKMMDRRQVNLEDIYIKYIADRTELNRLISKRENELKWFRRSGMGRFIASALGKNF